MKKINVEDFCISSKAVDNIKQNINKENIVKVGTGIALSAALIGSCAYSYHCGNKYRENLQAEISASAEPTICASAFADEVSDVSAVSYESVSNTENYTSFDFSSLPWKEMGYLNIKDYWDSTQAKRDSIRGIADKYIDKYGSKMTEQNKTDLRWYESCMLNAVYTNDFNAALNSFNSLVSQFVPKSYSSGGSGGSYSGGSYSGSYLDFMRDGIVYHNGNKFTYYSQSVLPGGGLNIPGRHTEDGFVKDGDGYIVVASDKGYGTVVDTPFGAGKSYDTGVSGNHYDIYVE